MADKQYDRQTFTSDYIKADTDQASFLGNIVLDNVVTALIALGGEVWTNQRRVMVLEALLEEKGVTDDMIEAYMPSEEKSAEWQEKRDAYIRRVFGALSNEGDMTLSSGRDYER